MNSVFQKLRKDPKHLHLHEKSTGHFNMIAICLDGNTNS